MLSVMQTRPASPLPPPQMFPRAAGDVISEDAHCSSLSPWLDANWYTQVSACGCCQRLFNRPIAPRSPWQNGYAERLIGSIRRDCLNHVVVFGERHLRHLLGSYQHYYNDARTHLSLNKDAPASRAVQAVGRIVANSHLGGLHHQYVRM